MNIFSANQVTQVYVATRLRTSTDQPVQVGDIKVCTDADGKVYFKHFGAGGLTRSDIIDPKLVTNVNADFSVSTTLDAYIIELNDDSLVAGEDYILRIAFDNYVGVSPEDSQYWKYGVVRVTSASMSTSDFYKNMAISLYKNMSREAYRPISIALRTSNSLVFVTDTTVNNLSGTYTSLVILEKKPAGWILGTKQQKRIGITVTPIDVEVPSESNPYKLETIQWAEVTKTIGGMYTNGKKMADFEYFHMGERADQYRMVGFPDYVPTKYIIAGNLAGRNQENTWNMVRVHYSYVGPNESVQKSEKDIAIICTPSITDSIYKAIITATTGNASPSSAAGAPVNAEAAAALDALTDTEATFESLFG